MGNRFDGSKRKKMVNAAQGLNGIIEDAQLELK